MLIVCNEGTFYVKIQHYTTVTKSQSVMMVNRITFFLILCRFAPSRHNNLNHRLNDKYISASCFEKATKLIKTLFSDMKNLEKQYQRIDKSLRIMGKHLKLKYKIKYIIFWVKIKRR